VFICGYLGIVSTELKGKIVKRIETFPIMIVIIISSILFVSSLILNQNQTAIAQQQQQALASKGISFGIDNVTFSHHIASVNSIQLHYVMGGHGDPIVLLPWLATDMV
jgi:uncharacterized membrane protein